MVTVNWIRRSAKPHARGYPPAGVEGDPRGLTVPVGVTTTAAGSEPLSVEKGTRAARMPSAAAAATDVRRINLFD